MLSSQMAQAALTLDRISALTSDGLHNRWLQGTIISAVTFAVFFLSSDRYDPYNQYVRLAHSLWHGRLDIVNPPGYLELARYPDGAYVINPPAPAVLLMPFVAIWGLATNEVVISMVLGAAAVGLFWVATRQLGWEPRLAAALTLLLAFGTNFWWAAADGSMWMFAHVTAIFFMMGALVEATGAKRPWLVGLLVGTAGLARLPTFLSFPFFAYLLLHGDQRSWTHMVRDREVLLPLGLFAAGLGVMFALDLLYNYERFGTFKDEGYYHPQYLLEPRFARGMNDISYIPRHLKAIFLQLPEFDSGTFPYFKPSWVGQGVFLTTPAFLYIFKSSINRLTVAAIVATVLTLVPVMTYGVTGATQFGYRYAIDVYPMLLVLTAAGMRHEMSPLKWGVVGLSCLIGLWGVLSFEQFDWVACPAGLLCSR